MWVIKSNLFFPLCFLVSLAHRARPGPEASQLVLHFGVHTAKWLPTPQPADRALLGTLNSRWRQPAVCGNCTGHCRLEQKQSSCSRPQELHPFPCWWDPYKAAPPTSWRESTCYRAAACAYPLFQERVKLPVASELNSSSYWWEWHQAGGPLLGTDSKRSVTNLQTHLWHKFHDNDLLTHLRFLRLLLIHNLAN